MSTFVAISFQAMSFIGWIIDKYVNLFLGGELLNDMFIFQQMTQFILQNTN